MGTKFHTWMAELLGFKRSYNFTVLSRDDEVKEIYREAGRTGRLPVNRSKVIFLGDARVGKTSLRRLLSGEKFQQNEPKTVGIETKICESTTVDSTWKQCQIQQQQQQQHFDDGASWYTATKARATAPKPLKQGEVSKSPQYTPGKYSQFWAVLLLVTKLPVLIMSLAIFLLDCNISIGFVLFELNVYIGVMLLLGLDFLTEVYRYGTGFVILTVFDRYIRYQVTLPTVLLYYDTSSVHMTILKYLIFCTVFFMCGYTLGVLESLGCRAGIAFALCVILTPTLSHDLFTVKLPESFIESTMPPLVESMFSLIGNIFGILGYGYFATNTITRSIPFVRASDSLVLSFYLLLLSIILTIFDSNSLFHSFILGMLLWSGKIAGGIRGRSLNAQVNLGYWPKKIFGFFLGVLFALMIGREITIPESLWSFPSCIILIFSIGTHPAVELYGYWKVLSQRIPIVKVGKALKAHEKGIEHLPMRLSLWDFAGDKLYYCTHHIFIASHAVYLVVFNLKEAIMNRKEQLERILFWLNSIYIHARHKDAVIFLVGTHRDSTDGSNRDILGRYLHENLYGRYCERLVINNDGRCLFLIENSVQLDQDTENLQRSIEAKLRDAEYVNHDFPIRFLHFYKVIEDRRTEAQEYGLYNIIGSYTEVQELVRRECGIYGVSEFEEMLDFFHRAGEIIYQPNHDTLKKYVIFDPQILVDVMKHLVSIPSPEDRPHQLAQRWSLLESKDIAHRQLLKHITHKMQISEDVIIPLLQAYDLICPIPSEQSEEQLYIVPCLLPRFEKGENPDVVDSFPLAGTKEVYYFDFAAVHPDVVFSRLLARCINATTATDPSMRRNIHFNMGKFCYDWTLNYSLELIHHLPDQNLIKVTVQRASKSDPRLFIEWLLEQLNIIQRRDFQYLEYTFGVQCPLRKHEEFVNVNKLHVIKLAGHDQKMIESSSHHIHFMCQGQECTVELFEESENTEWGSLPVHVETGLSTRLSNLPPSLYRNICNQLNVNQLLSGDWKDLAGELGLTSEDVQIIDVHRNPCEAVLRHWSKSDQDTVRNLIEILRRPTMSREDLVTMLLGIISKRE